MVLDVKLSDQNVWAILWGQVVGHGLRPAPFD
jgi:hypothetical protein